MVKDSKTPKPVRGFLPPPRPRGRAAKPGTTKDARVILRVHPDISALIDVRSKEAAMTRSAYIEKLLIAFMRADPRNRRVDNAGMFVPDLVSPHEFKALDPKLFNTKWKEFCSVFEGLFGNQPPSHWLESFAEVSDKEAFEEPDPAVGWPRAKKK